MFRRTVPIGRNLGISKDLGYSWFPIVDLLAWLLAFSYYPAKFPNSTATNCWVMCAITAVMLFVSVLSTHSIAAKGNGVSVPRITPSFYGTCWKWNRRDALT
jgi:hypothetical protein